ncbi:SIMPL domain-containing protein [Candidatus Nomurabacteria bacterium]|nr:SIMPL domain-containing protein [Candidatus Nomurabacteria bacterium]USN94613.1 MAG: SIMPL domain-containing protein [Candidatus Nomurabacteria bacterium]
MEKETLLTSKKIQKSLGGLLAILMIFFAFKTIGSIKELRYIGSDSYPSSTIYVEGEGEVFVVPDTAVVSFTVIKNDKDLGVAQDALSESVSNILNLIREEGILDEDIKTTSYSSNPVYAYSNYYYYPRPVKGEIESYEISETIEIRIKNTDSVSRVMEILGENEVTSIYGPNYTVYDMSALEDEARDMAISNAKEEAKRLADMLGVRLVRIVSYSEDYAYPYYDRAFGGDVMTLDAVESAPSPEIPEGEQKITKKVTVTYEIR